MQTRSEAIQSASIADFHTFKCIARRSKDGRPLDPYWSSRLLYRPLSIHVARAAIGLGVSSLVVASMAGLSLLTAALCYATPWPLAWLAGACLVVLFEIFDHADGEVARVERWRKPRAGDLTKEFVDTCCHAGEIAVVLAICFRLHVELGGPYWLLAIGLLRLFPGGIQPWQRYCETLVRLQAENGLERASTIIPKEALRVRSLAKPDRSGTGPRPVIRVCSLVSRTLGFPDYLLTLVACTVLDALPGAPHIEIAGQAIPWLLPWVIVTCLHSAAAGIKSTVLYARRLQSLSEANFVR